MQKQVVELKPISVNRCWQGRRFTTKEYKEWIKEGLYLLPKREVIKGECMIFLVFGVKYPKKCDVDNFIKPTLDLIVKKGYIEDDRFIQKITMEKIKSEKPYISIEII